MQNYRFKNKKMKKIKHASKLRKINQLNRVKLSRETRSRIYYLTIIMFKQDQHIKAAKPR